MLRLSVFLFQEPVIPNFKKIPKRQARNYSVQYTQYLV
jgi:hypothetical protein